MCINRVLIIGLGLIGGSFAKGLKQNRLVDVVQGYDQQDTEIQKGLELGVIDEAVEDLLQAVSAADIIMLAVPVKAFESVLAYIAPAINPSSYISDVGSTKLNIIEAARSVFGEVPANFIPGHPIAGAEKSGVIAAQEHLFERHKVILTPLENTSIQGIEVLSYLWTQLGAEVLFMSPEKHDEVLAATSHLPHVLAFSLVDTLAQEETYKDIFRYAAGGFRDFTRIAASDPVMWHDICLANTDPILKQLQEFSQGLERLQAAIKAKDSDTLLQIFQRAKAAREHFNDLIAGSAYEKK